MSKSSKAKAAQSAAPAKLPFVNRMNNRAAAARAYCKAYKVKSVTLPELLAWVSKLTPRQRAAIIAA